MASFELQYPSDHDEGEGDDEDVMDDDRFAVEIREPGVADSDADSIGSDDDEYDLDVVDRFRTLRNFAEFLDQETRVHGNDGNGDGGSDNHSDHCEVCVKIDPTTSPNDLRSFAVWLDGRSRRSNGTSTNSLRMNTTSLDIGVFGLQQDDERLQVLVQHGPTMFGHLVALGSPACLTLRLLCDDERISLPPGLLSSWLNALPNDCARTRNLTLELQTFDASAAQTLVRVIPHLRLGSLHLQQIQSSASSSSPQIASTILRAALNGELLSHTLALSLCQFDLSDIESDVWDLLSANRALKSLFLVGDLGVSTVANLASAVKCNTSLQHLDLSDHTTQGGLGAFADALAVNETLEELEIYSGRILESDLHDFSTALRRNRTLKLLRLPLNGLTAQGLKPLMETVRYHNNTLERVMLPPQKIPSFPWQLSAMCSACQFHGAFRAACQAHHSRGTVVTALDGDDADSTLRPWWPLLGSSHPTAKATVIFCLAQVRAETLARSMRVLPRPRKRSLEAT